MPNPNTSNAAAHASRRKSRAASETGAKASRSRPILAIDIGGSSVKILASGATDPRKTVSGKRMTPGRMVDTVRKLARDWQYEAISIGYPGLVGTDGPRSEPGNLGAGWVGFNFAGAFGLPVRIINDAAMHALGSYEGGRMLFIGLGTGLGSTLIAENVIVPLELGRLGFRRGRTLGELLGRRGLDRQGKGVWRGTVEEVVPMLAAAFAVDSIVIGGGNSRLLRDLPGGARLVHNLTAFRGGFRLWTLASVHTQRADDGGAAVAASTPAEWRVI